VYSTRRCQRDTPATCSLAALCGPLQGAPARDHPPSGPPARPPAGFNITDQPRHQRCFLAILRRRQRLKIATAGTMCGGGGDGGRAAAILRRWSERAAASDR